MKLTEILNLLVELSKEHNTSTPYITGGVPRDKLLGRLSDIEDIDITTGDSTVHDLARVFWEAVREQGGDYKVLPDGHAHVVIEGMKIDFSSNYRAPGIKEYLQKAGIKDPSEIMMELYSRDFTVNSLLMTMDLKTIKDITGLGVNDIKRKLIRTNLPAKITLTNNTKRVARVIYLAAKLGFSVDDEIKKFIISNPDIIKKDVKPKFLEDQFAKAAKYDEDKTVELIDELKLWSYVHPIEPLVPYMMKGRL